MKYTWIAQHSDIFSVSRMCRQLGVSRSGYCQWRVRAPGKRTRENTLLDAQVAQIHVGSRRSYGRRRIQQHLEADGMRVGHERIRQSLRRQCLLPVHKRAYRVTTDSDHTKPVAPNLLDRRFDGWKANQAWCADITYIGTRAGWLYLACVMDLASRRIVGWSISERMTAELVCHAVKSAYWKRKPPPGLIMHSDRGSQYASRAHRQLLTDFQMTQSMSRRANCWDKQRNGKLLQIAESRMRVSARLPESRRRKTRHCGVDRRLLQSHTTALSSKI